jgi:uncharacterized protein with NRDE domain
MCTVSLIESTRGLRLVANRDEQRSRARALPPVEVDLAGTGLRALMPIDPVSGGTWIAVNTAGLAVALLNVNPPKSDAPAPPRSRGEIVPRLAECRSLDALVDRALALDHRVYAPFRLVGARRDHVVEIVPGTRSVHRTKTSVPVMFTSSGLGDEQVEGPRRELFERTVLDDDTTDLGSRQDRFHAHRWPERPHLSVLMTRPDALTVSRTVVEIAEEALTMTYAAVPEWQEVAAVLARDR